jgi:hypothetical protein
VKTPQLILRALDEEGYEYIKRDELILLPGGPSNRLPRDQGLVIKPPRTGNYAVITLLTNTRIDAEEATRLLELNMELEGYCYAVDPEGFLAVRTTAPLGELVAPGGLRRIIDGLLDVLSRGGWQRGS